jgi:hypothetical protein
MAGDQDTTIKIQGDAQQAITELQRLQAEEKAMRDAVAATAAAAQKAAQDEAAARAMASEVAWRHAEQVKKIQNEYHDLGQAATAAGAATKGAADTSAQSVLDLGSAVTRITGKIFAWIGVLTTAYAALKALFDLTRSGADEAAKKADEFLKPFQNPGAFDNLRKINAELQRVNELQAQMMQPNVEGFKAALSLQREFGRDGEKIYKEKLEAERDYMLAVEADIQNAKKEAEAKAAQERIEAIKKEEQDKAAQIFALRQAALRSLMTDDERIQAEARDKIIEINQLKARNENEAQLAERRAAIDAVLKAETAALDKLAADRKAKADQERKQIEEKAAAERKRIDETTRREQDAIRQVAAAQAAFSQGTEATYQSNSLDLLQQIAQGIQSINQRQ